jgi:hypothetical protein
MALMIVLLLLLMLTTTMMMMVCFRQGGIVDSLCHPLRRRHVISLHQRPHEGAVVAVR